MADKGTKKYRALTRISGLGPADLEPDKTYDLDPENALVKLLVAAKYGGTELKTDFASLIPEENYVELKLAGLAVCSKCKSLLSTEERNAYVESRAATV